MKLIRAFLKTSPIFNFNLVERDAWVKLQAARTSGDSFVLDVGAGSCPYRQYFSHCNYKTQDFSELSPDQLRGRTGYDKIDYICDATQIPVKSAGFDVILCTEVLEHVPEPIKVINEFSRILKSGGKLLLTAPLGSGVHQEPWHFYGGYTPYWYQKFLTESEFSDISVEPNGGFFKHYGQESIRFAQMTVPWKLNAGLGWRLLWSPLWLIFLPWFAFILPVTCHFLDVLDQDNSFTIGYHVTATKKDVE